VIVEPLTDDELAGRIDIEDRDDVALLVRSFYRYAAMDDLLGPIFFAAEMDWPFHLAKLTDFWTWQLFGERGYDGQPLRAHESVNERTPFRDEHYDRWLELFVATVDELFVGPTADAAKQRATRMARALRKLINGEYAAGNEALVPQWTTPPR